MYEAIAYVISAMPMERAAESLRTFSLDILAQVHAITNKPTAATKQELQDVGSKFYPDELIPRRLLILWFIDGLENLEVMLHVIQSFGDELPAACQNSCEEAWSVFDNFIFKYGSDYDIAERTTRVLRHGVNLFGPSARSVAASVMARMSLAFEATGFPSYLWIAGKLIGRFGNEEDPALRASFQEVYERSTNKVINFLQIKAPGDIPDGTLNPNMSIAVIAHRSYFVVLEDYLQMLLQMVDLGPDIFFQSSAFPIAFRASMAALTLVHSDIIFASLDLFRLILTHDCLNPASSTLPPKFPIYASAIRAVIEKEGFEFVGCLLTGLVGDFPEDSTSMVVSIFRVLSAVWTTQLLSWLPPILQQLPVTAVPNQSKTDFLDEVTRFIPCSVYCVIPC